MNRTNPFRNVTIIVGAENELKSLITTVETVFQTCNADDIDKILLIHSNNVSAECLEIVNGLEKQYPEKVFGMLQKRPFIGGAVRDGFDAADSSHVMLLPGDLAISLDSVPIMIQKAKIQPDIITKTSRWLEKGSFSHYNSARKVLNKVAQLFLDVLFQTSLTDLTNPVQIMPTALAKKANWQELNFPFLEEMVLLPLRLGVKYEEIPAKCTNFRSEGKSKNSAKQTALYLKTALRIRFSSKAKLLKNES